VVTPVTGSKVPAETVHTLVVVDKKSTRALEAVEADIVYVLGLV
jgi:hypothetical protein